MTPLVPVSGNGKHICNLRSAWEDFKSCFVNARQLRLSQHIEGKDAITALPHVGAVRAQQSDTPTGDWFELKGTKISDIDS